MAVKPASTWATNWSGSSGRAVTAYTQGVQQTTADWAGNLLRQKSTMMSNWQQAVSSPNYDNAVNSVGNGGWKQATEAKSANFGVGFNAGAPKYAASAAKLQPFMSSAVNALPPRGDINANLQRSNALALALHAQRGNFKG